MQPRKDSEKEINEARQIGEEEKSREKYDT
jgi:hypothetical protein